MRYTDLAPGHIIHSCQQPEPEIEDNQVDSDQELASDGDEEQTAGNGGEDTASMTEEDEGSDSDPEFSEVDSDNSAPELTDDEFDDAGDFDSGYNSH